MPDTSASDRKTMRDPSRPIFIVTVVYGSTSALPGFLDSLHAQIGIDWRLVVIENRSPDGPSALLERIDDAKVSVFRNTGNLGFARAANQGIRVALQHGGEFVLLMNYDTLFDPNFLAELLAQRDRHDARVIAPRIMAMTDGGRSWYAGGHFDQGWIFTNVHEAFDPSDVRPARRVEFASGCCLGIMSDVLGEVGLLDETFFVYWEDSDFCLRLKARDIAITYVRDPFLLHAGGASSGGEFSAAFNRLYYRNYMRFLVKHFGRIEAAATALRLVLRELNHRPANLRMAWSKASAMAGGLLSPRRPEPRL